MRRLLSGVWLLKTSFCSINKWNFKPLFNTYIRPHIEYCSQAVGPYMVKNFMTLEKVQRRATKLVRGLKNVPYQERLQHLGLSTAKQRMTREDLIEAYKILTGKLRVDPGSFFERNTGERSPGHSVKLVKSRAAHQARTQFFSQRTVTPWNELPEEVVSAPSTNSFKNRLDQYWTTRDPA